ncbi:unnamed protein product, partial [Didymodactylos carnosus]
MIHTDGMNIVTTKLKKFYVVTGTVIEIPPPLREYSKNKLLFSLYLSENEPTAKLLFSRLVAELKQIINRNYFTVANNKFQLRFQALKADLRCRALCLYLKQHNG